MEKTKKIGTLSLWPYIQKSYNTMQKTKNESHIDHLNTFHDFTAYHIEFHTSKQSNQT